MANTTTAAATSASRCAINKKAVVDRSWLSNLLAAHAHKLDPAFPVRTDPALRGKALVVAPMVDQSDLPFRLLCRRSLEKAKRRKKEALFHREPVQPLARWPSAVLNLPQR